MNDNMLLLAELALPDKATYRFESRAVVLAVKLMNR